MNPSAGRRLVVSLHDFHPGSRSRIEAQCEALASWGVKQRSILVVPEFHHGARTDEPETAAWLRARQAEGDELVLHGYYHDRIGQADTLGNVFWTRFYTNREAEFLDLPSEAAQARLAEGRRFFAEAGFGGKNPGFIAPAWLMAPHLTGILAEMGFAHTTTLRHFIPLDGREPIPSQSLCWSTRAGWRRAASLAWNRRLHPRLAPLPLLRISLHPDDFTFVTIRKQIERIVKSELDAGRAPVTYADACTSAH